MFLYAEVAEQADAHDSNSCGVTLVGSTPTFGITVCRLISLLKCAL